MINDVNIKNYLIKSGDFEFWVRKEYPHLFQNRKSYQCLTLMRYHSVDYNNLLAIIQTSDVDLKLDKSLEKKEKAFKHSHEKLRKAIFLQNLSV